MADTPFTLPPFDPVPEDSSAKAGETPLPPSTPPAPAPATPPPAATIPIKGVSQSLPVPPPASPQPTPPPPVSPTPATPPPSAPQQDLSSLSPFKILQHRGESTSLPVPPVRPLSASPATPPAAPATPPPIPPTIPPKPLPAATPPPVASTTPPPFSKPQTPPAPPTTPPTKPSVAPQITPKPAAVPPAPTPNSQPLSGDLPIPPKLSSTPQASPPPLTPPPAPPVTPPAPPVAPQSTIPVPAASLSSQPTPPAAPTADEAKAVEAEKTPAPVLDAQSEPPHSSRVGVIAVLGLLLAILLLLGSGYILALNGTRVPVFYSLVSGLKSNGKSAAADALAYTTSQDSYTYASEVTMTIATPTPSEPPALPTDTSTSSSFYDLKATTEGAMYKKDGKGAVESTSIAVDTGGSLPVAVRVNKESDTNWLLYFPDNLNAKVVSLDKSEAHETIFQPLLHPIPLASILQAVTTTTGAQKRQTTGRVVTDYAVNYNADVLKDFLPDGATLEGANGTLELAWKGTNQTANQPVGALVKGTLKYAGRQYQFREVWNVGLWNSTLDTTKFSFVPQVLDDASIGTPSTVTIKDVAAQLGISDFSTVPQSASVSPSPSPSPTASPTATPSPTASATPTSSPSASSQAAATPTGEKITQLQASITTNPPVPTQPATDAAKTRDSQRKQDLALLQAALERYKTDNGQYPATQGAEQTLSSATLFNALVPKYLTAMPVDPLPSTYWYEYQANASTYALRSILENAADPDAKKGGSYSFYQLTNQ